MYGLILHSITRLFWRICTADHLETPNRADGEYCKTKHLRLSAVAGKWEACQAIDAAPCFSPGSCFCLQEQTTKRCVYSLLSLKCMSDRLVFCLLFYVETSNLLLALRRSGVARWISKDAHPLAFPVYERLWLRFSTLQIILGASDKFCQGSSFCTRAK